METLKDELTSQLFGKGRIRIVDPGSRPTGYFRDRRESRLKLWAVFGALPGLLALLFFAFRGKRRQLV